MRNRIAIAIAVYLFVFAYEFGANAAITFFYPDTHMDRAIFMSVSILNGSSGAQKTVIGAKGIWSDKCLNHRVGLSSGMAIGKSSKRAEYNFFFNNASLDYYYKIVSMRTSAQSNFDVRIGAETGFATLQYGSFSFDNFWITPAIAADFYYDALFVWAYTGAKYNLMSQTALSLYAYEYDISEPVSSLGKNVVESINGLTVGYLITNSFSFFAETACLASVYPTLAYKIFITPAAMYSTSHYAISAGWAYPANDNAKKIIGQNGGFVLSVAWRF